MPCRSPPMRLRPSAPPPGAASCRYEPRLPDLIVHHVLGNQFDPPGLQADCCEPAAVAFRIVEAERRCEPHEALPPCRFAGDSLERGKSTRRHCPAHPFPSGNGHPASRPGRSRSAPVAGPAPSAKPRRPTAIAATIPHLGRLCGVAGRAVDRFATGCGIRRVVEPLHQPVQRTATDGRQR